MSRRVGRYALLAAAITAGGALVWLSQAVDCLVVRQIDTPGSPVRRVAVLAPGDTFHVAWRHSVEREAWIETFKNIDHGLWLTQTRFKTFGAGVPAHGGRRTRLVDGWVVMSGIDRAVPDLTYQAAAAENYRIRIGDGAWQALSASDAAPILSFAINTRRRGAVIWNGLFDHD